VKFNTDEIFAGLSIWDLRKTIYTRHARRDRAPEPMTYDPEADPRRNAHSRHRLDPDRAPMVGMGRARGVQFKTMADVIEIDAEGGGWIVVVTWKLLDKRGSFPVTHEGDSAIESTDKPRIFHSEERATEAAQAAERQLMKQMQRRILNG